MSLIKTKILLGLSLVLSLTATVKTQCFVNLSFNSILQLINGILRGPQKLLRYFNGTAIAASSRILFAAAVLPINLVFYLKDLKLSSAVAMALLALMAI